LSDFMKRAPLVGVSQGLRILCAACAVKAE
jgi:hypothetical protein